MICLVWRSPLRIIEDGVYFIKNNYSQKYLHVQYGSISGLTPVNQQSKAIEGTHAFLRQSWKIYYLGSGFYSIRPMHKLDMVVKGSSGGVVAFPTGTDDSLSALDKNSIWYITQDFSGYVFKINNENIKTLSILSDSINDGITATTFTDSGLARQRWGMEKILNPPSGVILYMDELVTSNGAKVWIGNESSHSMNSLGLTATRYSPTDITQDFFWVSHNEDIITVDENTGDITAYVF